jgi:hypothetical protein
MAGSRKVRPTFRKLTDAEREFLDRAMADDRVVGVRFGESVIDVQVVRHRGKVDLPETFDGRPVTVQDFPNTPDPADFYDGPVDQSRPGPLADLF